ncbi:MAG: hypothetical protein KGO49_02305 [Gammaproteobacteria bacterium]|nr:hypothetical protein [Gammaproteobacteria bacterium]
MSHEQHSKQQNRPSLYEPRGTTTAFSILGAAQPLGWSKQKSIGLSIISFIAGGVLSGGAVGLLKSTDQPSAPVSELATSTIPKTIPEPTKPMPMQPIAYQKNDHQQIDHKEDRLQKTLSPLPIKNPLVSFKEDDIQKTIRLKTGRQKVEAHNFSPSKDDAQLQRLIEKKTEHSDVSAPTHITNNRVGSQSIEKPKLEQDKHSADTTQKNKTKNDQSTPITHAVVTQKKPRSHDKDVLLVKSMLDTMDRPLAANITTKAKASDDTH